MRLNFFSRSGTDKLSDTELIEKYRTSGDKHYVGVLYKRYTHLVFGSCMKYFKNHDDSEDAVVMIFEKMMSDLLRHEVTHFKSWLYQVTRNHCLMELRKRITRDKNFRDFEKDAQNFVETENNPHLDSEREVKVQREETYDALEKAIEELKPEQKECIDLFYLQEMSYKEIADKTCFSLKEVKSHIQNGKRNLRKLLGSLIFIFIILEVMKVI